MTETTSNNWKAKYKESAKAIAQKEHMLEECENLLNEAVSQLCKISINNPSGSEKAIKQLQKISQNGASQIEISCALTALHETATSPESEGGFIRRFFGTKNSDTAEEHQTALSAHQLLQRLLNKLAIPESHQSTVNAIRQQLSTTPNDEELIQSLDQIAEIIGKIRTDLIAENAELSQFLDSLGKVFSGISKRVHSIGTYQTNSSKKQALLTSTLEAEVITISSSLANNRAVQPLLQSLVNSITTYKKEAELINGSRVSEVGKLTEEISSLKKEADGLRDKLKDYRTAAYQDGLTKIPNRLAYDDRLKEEFARWKRFDHPVSLLVWDIDKFKAINDTYGHQEGDKILRSVAAMLQDHIRETDFLARYGGEEFVIILPGAQMRYAKKVAEKLRKLIETMPLVIDKKTIHITMSCGISEFREGDSPNHVFSRADKALYSAKEAGRNAVVID